MDGTTAPPILPARYAPVGPLRPDGALWRCEDAETGLPVVCRVVPAPREEDGPAAALRLRHGLWALTRPRHAALIGVQDRGIGPDGSHWLVVPWIAAPRLADAGPLAPAAVARLLGDLLGALDCLHRHGLVHGALDARRVRVAPDGAATIMDAGLAAEALEGRGRLRGGRPDADPRADLRAAGALALAALPDAPATPDWLPAGTLPGAADAVLRRLLATEPEAGFGSAREALAALGLATPGDDELLPAAPLIGRATEMARLGLALARTLGGQAGGMVWLSGPAGVGKGRLLDAFAREVATARLAFGRGAPEQGAARGPDAPYGPLVRALRGLLPLLRRHVPETLARHAPVLGRLLPELAPAGAAPTLDPPAARLRLQGAVAEILAELARQRGLVLAIEGWERLDPLTVEALARIRRATRETPFLLVVTATDADRRPDWAQDAEPLLIGALPGAALGAMAAALLGVPEVPEGLVERLARASGGMPVRAEAALRGLVATGALRRVADGSGAPAWALAPNEPGERAADPLAGLPPTAVAVARAAAVLGGAADLDVLGAACGLPEEALFEALEVLRRAAILAPGVDGELGFTRPALLEHVLHAMPADVRVGLHDEAARAYHARPLAERPADAPLDTAAAIARHALLADASRLAAPFALEAGRRLAALHALDEAEVLLEDGLACVRGEGRAAWLGLRLEFLEALADARRVAGKAAGALDLYLEAVRLAEALGDQVRLGRVVASLAKIHQVLDDLPAAAAAGERALRVAEATGDVGGQARSLLTTARLAIYANRAGEARDLAAEALARAREIGDTERTAEALSLYGYLLAQAPETRGEGVEALQEAIALLTGLGDPVGLNMAALLLGDAQAAAGELEAARKSYTLARWILLEVGARTEAGITAINLGLTALELGELAEAAARADEARAIALEIGHRFQLALADALGAATADARGDLAEALRLADAAAAGALEVATPYLDALVQPLVLEARLRAGDLAGADEAARPLAGEEAPAAAARRLALLAEVWGRRGDAARARLCAAGAREAALLADAPIERARAHRAAAWVALAAGDLLGARAEAEEARALAERLGLRLQLAAAEGLLGEVARLAGDRDPRPHFEAMARAAAEAGARWLEAEAREAVGALDPGGPAAEEAVRLVEAAVAGLDEAARARLDQAWIVRRVASALDNNLVR